MKRMFVWMLLCLGVAFASLSVAQTEQLKYTVQSGDNLWNLAGQKLDDARLWSQIMEDNLFLKQDGRKFVKEGRVYVLIRPGEKLVGLEKLGIVPTLSSLDTLVRAPESKDAWYVEYSNWLWFLAALLALLLLAMFFIRRMLDANPATARSPIIPGGVNERSAQAAFQEMARRQYGGQQFQILQQTVGRIWGVMNVSYADGKNIPRRLNGERAYRAKIRFPDQHEEELYMLQACGNDLRYGGVSKYLPGPDFRFEAEEVQQPAAAQAAPAATTVTPATTQTAQPAVPAVPAEAEQTAEEGEDRIVIHFDAASAKQPSNLLQVKGKGLQSFTFRVGPNGPSIRFRETAAAV